jgi:hypothetical protein
VDGERPRTAVRGCGGYVSNRNSSWLLYKPTFLMDKKVKKKSHVLQQRIQALRQQLAGAKKQLDDPDELKSIQEQLAVAEAELAKIKEP